MIVLQDASAGTTSWDNLSNATVVDNTYASSTMSGNTGDSASSYYIKVLDWGFELPSNAVILGVVVTIKHKASGTGVRATEVKLVKGGTIQATNKGIDSANIGTTDDTYDTYGAIDDLWSGTWTAGDINDEDFGVVVRYRNCL